MRLHVHEWGEPGAPGVVCLHGVTGHGRRFRKLAEERLSGHHVLAPDLRGHGRSGWEEPWTLAAHVADLAETFTEPAVWIGHSFGARLILELIAHRPDLTRGAVLLDPAIYVPPEFAEQHAAQERQEKAYGSAAEAIAGWTGLFHTPREILEEEMREHGADPTRRRRRVEARQRGRGRALPGRAGRQSGGRRHTGRAQPSLGRLSGDRGRRRALPRDFSLEDPAPGERPLDGPRRAVSVEPIRRRHGRAREVRARRHYRIVAPKALAASSTAS